MNRGKSIAAVALLAWLAACAAPVQESTTEVVVVHQQQMPSGPDDAGWNGVPFHTAELLLQDMVEPRLLDASTPTVEVRAVTDGRRIAFKLSWVDVTQNDLPGASRFVDACAVQIPAVVEPNVPAPQMGEQGRAVEIAYWRASWQAVVDGREDTIQGLYPNATVDHYPFTAASLEPGSQTQQDLESQYSPARTLGQQLGGPRDSPVQDLLAEGPGTLSTQAAQVSEGAGRRVDEGWDVVIVRPLPPNLDRGQRTQVAFAVWDGEHDEVGARKMRSGWIPLHLNGESE